MRQFKIRGLDTTRVTLHLRYWERTHMKLRAILTAGWVASNPNHLDFLLDSGIDCGKRYSLSFIFACGRGHALDFVRSQVLRGG